ncbi:uncharacterized protein [Macrobrachium rosenbergii]|uniref:uncharacterized protein n=1 Tax=Macrobrachium rosenbergii TaxID=79674 RepID=UPI0034D724E6
MESPKSFFEGIINNPELASSLITIESAFNSPFPPPTMLTRYCHDVPFWDSHSPTTPILLSTPNNYSHSLPPTTAICSPNYSHPLPTTPIHSPNYSHTLSLTTPIHSPTTPIRLSTPHNYFHSLQPATPIYSQLLPSTPHYSQTPIHSPSTPILLSTPHNYSHSLPPTTPIYSPTTPSTPQLLPSSFPTTTILPTIPSILPSTPNNYYHSLSPLLP